ncbi:right-handed parallel beta-helix repeat-containing protein [Microbulbifer sp. ZKSA004]|uniref:right-handed parallel beta-helix repeat-containing protein n=1 Tax=Microbulbifer sp. ZKSA004 TaxID=3243389 RepID=UPI004038FCB8
MSKKILGLAFTPITILISASMYTPPVGAVECGEVIVTSVTLDQDLLCDVSDGNPPALTVVGPSGNLILNGYTVSCISSAGGNPGILVEGIASRISGGEVNNCPEGILVQGNGSHTISEMEVRDFRLDGIEIDSNYNIISENMVIGLPGTTVGDGIDSNGDGTTIIQNYVEGVGDGGMEIGGDFINVTLNQVAMVDDLGIFNSGNFTTISNNHLENNSFFGIATTGSFGLIIQNNITGNGDGGVEIRSGNDNIVSQNSILNNGGFGISDNPGGIVISGEFSSRNQILSNTVTGNTDFDLWDVFDSGDCSSDNQWVANIHDTSSPACLD